MTKILGKFEVQRREQRADFPFQAVVGCRSQYASNQRAWLRRRRLTWKEYQETWIGGSREIRLFEFADEQLRDAFAKQFAAFECDVIIRFKERGIGYWDLKPVYAWMTDQFGPEQSFECAKGSWLSNESRSIMSGGSFVEALWLGFRDPDMAFELKLRFG
ncbi:MAG: hypothetical protein DI537_39460 [Stutzerimonas stutzeri]|nr:MAG: hypothetical protein DI537_39460 [Stutzerimonas stutzeri]